VKIGVISDSHDRLEAISAAVDRFNAEGVQHVFHAGDIISPFTVSCFKPLRARLHIVWGNNDGDRLLLRERFGEIQALIHGNFMDLELGGRRIAMTHGTEEAVVQALARCGGYDLVIRGHTHQPEIGKEGAALVVNPGDASGYLAGERTVAVVDLEAMEARLVTLP